MMRSGKLWGNSEPFAEVCHDLRGELRAAIRDDGLRKSVIFPDMEEIEFCGVQRRGGLVAWDELRFFGEAINHGENRVESVGKGKIGDEVDADVHPRHRAWLKWHSSAGRLCIASLEASTPITTGDIGFNVGGQPGPIVMAFNEFLGFLISCYAWPR